MSEKSVNSSKSLKDGSVLQVLPKLVLLTVLYMIQGVPIGFFTLTVPLQFKKYLDYQQIGMLALCTLPFSCKVLWSPFVEFKYIKQFGRRKSWIIPTQLVMILLLFYLRAHLEESLKNGEVQVIAFVLTLFIFTVTC